MPLASTHFWSSLIEIIVAPIEKIKKRWTPKFPIYVPYKEYFLVSGDLVYKIKARVFLRGTFVKVYETILNVAGTLIDKFKEVISITGYPKEMDSATLSITGDTVHEHKETLSIKGEKDYRIILDVIEDDE